MESSVFFGFLPRKVFINSDIIIVIVGYIECKFLKERIICNFKVNEILNYVSGSRFSKFNYNMCVTCLAVLGT